MAGVGRERPLMAPPIVSAATKLRSLAPRASQLLSCAPMAARRAVTSRFSIFVVRYRPRPRLLLRAIRPKRAKQDVSWRLKCRRHRPADVERRQGPQSRGTAKQERAPLPGAPVLALEDWF